MDKGDNDGPKSKSFKKTSTVAASCMLGGNELHSIIGLLILGKQRHPQIENIPRSLIQQLFLPVTLYKLSKRKCSFF